MTSFKTENYLPETSDNLSLRVIFFDKNQHCISDSSLYSHDDINAIASHLKNLGFSSKNPVVIPISNDNTYYYCAQIDVSLKQHQYSMQAVGASIFKYFHQSGFTFLEVIWPSYETLPKPDLLGLDDFAQCLSNIYKGILSADYSFTHYKKDKNTQPKPAYSLSHVWINQEDLQKRFNTVKSILIGEQLAKDLMNEPPNVLTPVAFSNRIKMLEKYGLEVDILDEKRLEEENMHALLSVGQGSTHQSRLACMRWQGATTADSRPLVLVGKGVCFDSGGINIKLSQLTDMKYDMGGAASVVGAMASIAALKIPTNVVGIVALTENMPGGKAYRPSDIISSRSGKKIEVLNTDAEGRLILADAIDYATDLKPRAIVDLATLTGAIIVALGHEYAGLFCNDAPLLNHIQKASENSGEKIWRMPLDNEYDTLIDSPIADVQNLSAQGGKAGSVTAAQFLQRFTKDFPWAHIDIAGTAWIPSDNAVHTKGPTGYGVSLLVELASQYAD